VRASRGHSISELASRFKEQYPSAPNALERELLRGVFLLKEKNLSAWFPTTANNPKKPDLVYLKKAPYELLEAIYRFGLDSIVSLEDNEVTPDGFSVRLKGDLKKVHGFDEILVKRHDAVWLANHLIETIHKQRQTALEDGIDHYFFSVPDAISVQSVSSPLLPAPPPSRSNFDDLIRALPQIDEQNCTVTFKGKIHKLRVPQIKVLQLLANRQKEFYEGKLEAPQMHKDRIYKSLKLPLTAGDRQMRDVFKSRSEAYKALIKSHGAGNYSINL
jgi:hypothetical protein